MDRQRKGKLAPEKRSVPVATFRTVIDPTGDRDYYERTYAPCVAWLDILKTDFSSGKPEMDLRFEKMI